MSTTHTPALPSPSLRYDLERPRPKKASRLWWTLSFLVGWAWRIAVGARLCFVYLGLSFLTSVAVFGWTYRWMQGLVLYGWWKQSRFRDEGTFEEFCSRLGPDAPVARPRWFLQERIAAHLNRPTRRGRAPGRLRKACRLLVVPWHSLWLNFKIGVQGLFCTYLVTGLPCLLMYFSWKFGWLNSFHKGYEEAALGALMGLAGIALFCLVMIYVPMAQVHQAATGRPSAFFDFRFIGKLVRARLTAYLGLALLLGLASLVLEITRVVAVDDYFPGNNAETDALGYAFFHEYLSWVAVYLFVSLLLLRGLAAALYRSAVLKVLRRGWVRYDELDPVLAGWLDRLEMRPTPAPSGAGLLKAARMTGGWGYRRVLFVVLFFVWFAFCARFYVGHFLHANDWKGFLVHPLIQLPCCDEIPMHLYLKVQGQ
jgi:hypothetical protein